MTSVEVEQAFFLGEMATLGGSIFVERRRPQRMRSDMRQLRDVMSNNTKVCLYPEGTSSDGQGVLPFKPALFAAASNQGVQPAALTYHSISGRRPSAQRLQRVSLVQGHDIPDHLLRLLAQTNLHIIIDVPRFAMKRDISAHCEHAIRTCYRQQAFSLNA